MLLWPRLRLMSVLVFLLVAAARVRDAALVGRAARGAHPLELAWRKFSSRQALHRVLYASPLPVVAESSGRRMRMCALGCASPSRCCSESAAATCSAEQMQFGAAESLSFSFLRRAHVRPVVSALHTGLLTNSLTHPPGERTTSSVSRQSAPNQSSCHAVLLGGLLQVEHRHTKTKCGCKTKNQAGNEQGASSRYT